MEAILTDVWFGWFDAIYQKDPDALWRVVATTPFHEAGLRAMEQLSFDEQIARPVRNAVEDRELPQAMLNFSSLEALRRAFVGAIKSIEIAAMAGLLNNREFHFLEVSHDPARAPETATTAAAGAPRNNDTKNKNISPPVIEVLVPGIRTGKKPSNATTNTAHPTWIRER